MGHPGLIYRDGFQYAYASFYEITIPFTGVIFLKRQWMLGKRFGYVTPGEMLSDYFQGDMIRILVVVVALLFSIPYLGVQLGERGEYEAEIEMYRRALAIKPDLGMAWANLGVALASSGQMGASEEPFTNACKFQPDSANNWLNLAKLHHAMGRSEQAAEAMSRAKELKGAS